MDPHRPATSVASSEDMADREKTSKPKRFRFVRWLFLFWAVLSTGWMANSFRTQDVDPALLHPGAGVGVLESDEYLEFVPAKSNRSGLIFICGSGVEAAAYAPMLRPIADEGYPVVIVKLPFRFAFLESHKEGALDRVHRAVAGHSQDMRWVIAGHSLGAALACRVVQAPHDRIGAMVVLGTTHPKEDDLSGLTLPVTKVVGSLDGVAPSAKVEANRHLLPKNTKWIYIEGGNHSQFGNYGHQLMDGTATISRDEQQRQARQALLDSLAALR